MPAVANYPSPPRFVTTMRPSASNSSCRFEHHLPKHLSRGRRKSSKRTILLPTSRRRSDQRSGRSKTTLTSSNILIATTSTLRNHGMLRVTRRVAVVNLKISMMSSPKYELRSHREQPNSLRDWVSLSRWMRESLGLMRCNKISCTISSTARRS